jgi:hypothetical protein
VNTTQSFKTATDSRGLKVNYSSTKTQHSWHHSVDTKHILLHVKFEGILTISLKSKSMPNKKVAIFMEDDPSFSQKRSLENFAVTRKMSSGTFPSPFSSPFPLTLNKCIPIDH